MTKKALITGITGQIGSYLAEILLEQGYKVHGLSRNKLNSQIPEESQKKIIFHSSDIKDLNSLQKLIEQIKPDEIYNLAAQSNSQISFDIAEETFQTNALAILRICETVKKLNNNCKVFQASSAELYGGTYDYPVTEETPFIPRNPYGIAKFTAYWTIKIYREANNSFFVNGIIFNSESPRRGDAFVTKKIVKGIADIIKGKQEVVSLGNINSKRDWGHAKDTAYAIYKSLQAEKPGDYIISTGKAHTIREFIELAFKHLGKKLAWRGQGLNEEGYDLETGKVYININPQFFRPVELKVMLGNPAKARKELNWQPQYTFESLVNEMIDYDMSKN
ncbi:GDP-mannose 4,6-dehydratase [Candidatus Pacearchaeota archaeon CG10_big_fil_rev_8_21_14_0_10_31_24]|nr:MAG: GDP-mannose 4,6-dehydratase [Candidatus Pacearchaeota archaeon CG10_big_fil_rev_8_21_14_0_10_31_24]